MFSYHVGQLYKYTVPDLCTRMLTFTSNCKYSARTSDVESNLYKRMRQDRGSTGGGLELL